MLSVKKVKGEPDGFLRDTLKTIYEDRIGFFVRKPCGVIWAKYLQWWHSLLFDNGTKQGRNVSLAWLIREEL